MYETSRQKLLQYKSDRIHKKRNDKSPVPGFNKAFTCFYFPVLNEHSVHSIKFNHARADHEHQVLSLTITTMFAVKTYTMVSLVELIFKKNFQ